MKSFKERVVEAVMSIPEGRVTTYGHISRACGGGNMASRSITSILGKAYNEGNRNIPFHRIVYSNGKIWINEEYHDKRMKLYKKEGIEVDEKGKIKNFKEILFEFK